MYFPETKFSISATENIRKPLGNYFRSYIETLHVWRQIFLRILVASIVEEYASCLLVFNITDAQFISLFREIFS